MSPGFPSQTLVVYDVCGIIWLFVNGYNNIIILRFYNFQKLVIKGY